MIWIAIYLTGLVCTTTMWLDSSEAEVEGWEFLDWIVVFLWPIVIAAILALFVVQVWSKKRRRAR